ncbi:MAG: hypothetical protein HYS81_05045 [Candidatus Aenigmatarchaeota archaeon]|nr:MAG: hypothetical protein HYS81_05045 [Candidatus Aenigmarchaeota archaeon]
MGASHALDGIPERIADLQSGLRTTKPDHPLLGLVYVHESGIGFTKAFLKRYSGDAVTQGLPQYVADLERAVDALPVS